MKRVTRSKICSASYTEARVDRFARALANAIKIYYSLDSESQQAVDDVLGEDFIVDIEDSVKSLSDR